MGFPCKKDISSNRYMYLSITTGFEQHQDTASFVPVTEKDMFLSTPRRNPTAWLTNVAFLSPKRGKGFLNRHWVYQTIGRNVANKLI